MFGGIEKKVRKQFKAYMLPYLGLSVLDSKLCQEFRVKDQVVTLTLCLDFPHLAIQNRVQAELKNLVQAVSPNFNLNLSLGSNIRSHQSHKPNQVVKGVKNLIAIGSGKGGVGKSTTAVNLALALQQSGARVGLLDADIYGPSIPKMLGTEGAELNGAGKQFHPILQHGIYSASIAYMIDPDKALVWRGPMVSQALQQLLNEALWPELDYLLIDLPPGTGDIQLTLAQKIPVNGAVIVTTPQDIALLDAIKAHSLFDKVNIPVLGIIENMSQHQCSQCGHTEHLFGQAGGQKLAEKLNIPLLGKLPLDLRIRQHADEGTSLFDEPNLQLNQHYLDAALKMVARLSHQAINYSTKLPCVKVE